MKGVKSSCQATADRPVYDRSNGIAHNTTAVVIVLKCYRVSMRAPEVVALLLHERTVRQVTSSCT